MSHVPTHLGVHQYAQAFDSFALQGFLDLGRRFMSAHRHVSASGRLMTERYTYLLFIRFMVIFPSKASNASSP